MSMTAVLTVGPVVRSILMHTLEHIINSIVTTNFVTCIAGIL